MENILVTGGAGFIGSHLVDRLVALGQQVLVVDDMSTGQEGNLEESLTNGHVKLFAGDIRNKKMLRPLLKKCALVFHLAANSDIRNGTSNTAIDFERNLEATHSLLECIKDSPSCRRLLFTSTSTVYGEPQFIPTVETYGPLKPISLYGASKLGCEGMISAYSHLFGIESTILRLANVIGSRSNHGVVFDVTRKILQKSDIVEILGNGRQRKSYLHVDDCIDAILLAAGLRHSGTEIFNVGSSDAIPVQQIVRTVYEMAGQYGGKEIVFRHNGDGRGWPGDVKEMLLDCSKVVSKGWRLHYTSQSAIEATVKGLLGPIDSDSMARLSLAV